MKLHSFRIFIILLLTGFLFSGCTKHKSNFQKTYGNPLHTDMLSSKIIILSNHSFKRDSFNIYCNHELIPENYNKWLTSSWTDYENNTKGTSFIFYNMKSGDRENGISTNTYVMNFTVSGTDTTFHIEKRTVSSIQPIK